MNTLMHIIGSRYMQPFGVCFMILAVLYTTAKVIAKSFYCSFIGVPEWEGANR